MITTDNIPAVRRYLNGLQANDRELNDVAIRLIKKSVEWDHPKGRRGAGGHSEHIKPGPDGLELVFGENRFLVGKAVIECASKVDLMLESLVRSAAATPNGFEIKKALQNEIMPIPPQCVRPRIGLPTGEWQHYKKGGNEFMRFGNQEINVNEFVEEFLKISELRMIVDEI